jgi:hypothetical protein
LDSETFGPCRWVARKQTWKIPNPSFVKIEFLCRRWSSYHAHENYSAVKEVPGFGFRRFHIRKNEKSQNLVGFLTIHVQMCFSEIYRNQFDPSHYLLNVTTFITPLTSRNIYT